MGTSFVEVYNRFLGKITDDLYIELTQEDTIRDLRNLIIDAIPNFEFPRKRLDDYIISHEVKREDLVTPDEFIIGIIWDNDMLDAPDNGVPNVLVETSRFNVDLTSEEINIIAVLMLISWVQRQVTSIENTRMKYSGADFKMTSQANHLQKLLALLEDVKKQSKHIQRLYKRRRIESDTEQYRSNWDIFGPKSRYGNKI